MGRITTKNLPLCPWEITKKSFRGKLLTIFHFLTLWIWLFGIFDKRPQGCHEVKNSMGILQGPRLMAWTTKRPILENQWVPWGCRAHLGSVKRLYRYFGSIVMSNVCENVILEKRKLNRQTVWGMITAMITSFFSRYPICAQWQIFYLCVWSFLNLFYWIYLFSKSINKTLLMGSSFIFFHYVNYKKR